MQYIQPEFVKELPRNALILCDYRPVKLTNDLIDVIFRLVQQTLNAFDILNKYRLDSTLE